MAEIDGRPIGEDDLHGYVDQRLGAARLGEVRRWLDANPEAGARVRAWTAQRDLLRAALAPLAEAPIPQRLRVAHLRGQLRARRVAALRAAAAALALVLLGGGAGWLIRGHLTPGLAVLPALELPAALAHRTFAATPERGMELFTANPDRLAAWFSRRASAPMVVPQLAGEGYALVGGRVVPGEAGPALLALYRGPGQPVSFHAALASQAEARPMRCHDNPDGSLTYRWSDLLFDYAVTATDLPLERLRVLARLAEQEVQQGPRAPDEAPRIAMLRGPARPACLS